MVPSRFLNTTSGGIVARQRHDNDNDNDESHYLVGAGNLKWVKPDIPDMTANEIATLAKPLVELHGWIGEASHAIRKRDTPNNYQSVCVISDIYGVMTKIGKAACPLVRLSQLQTGNPNRLFIHRLFWIRANFTIGSLTQSTSDAVDFIERTAHVKAGSRHARLEGEWFKCSPSDAHDAIYDAISTAEGIRRIKAYCIMTPPSRLWRAAA